MGKGKRSREPGTRRRTILQIDSNKISRSSNVRAAPAEPVAAPAKDPVDDQVAEFLREISALEQEQESAKNVETDPSDPLNNPSIDLAVPTNSSHNETLPEGWERILDSNSGFHYFWNVRTNETRWDPPPQNPVGLSLISSAYSESDSDSPVHNQPLATHTEEGDKTREIPHEENKPQTDASYGLKMHPNSASMVEKKPENTISSQTGREHMHFDNEGNSDELKPKAKRAREDPKPPPVDSSTQTEEGPSKPTEDALRPLIQQLAAELTHKLDFLGISVQQVNQLQSMLIQLETRISDWRSGHLPSEYTLSRLQESARILCEYEQSAAPVGWGCTWDPSSQRYQYVQVSSGVTMWEYPTTRASTEVLEDEDMVLSGGESDENPPLPPMPPSPSGPPPPPSSQNDAKSAVETKPSPPPPLPNSDPPLPDLPPTHAPAPPPLPKLRELTLPEEPPPLPPSRQEEGSSPPLPPCSETVTPPLPPSDTSSHMSESPSTLPNSPRPPSEPDTHTQEPAAAETYNTSHYDGASTQYYIQPEQQPQQLVYTYYTPVSYPPKQTSKPPVETRRSTSPVSKVKSKTKKAANTSSLATHAVSVKKKGMANMLEKWQQLSTVETSSGESESEQEQESSLKQRIEEWKKEQVISGRAKENANFDNIRGNWKEKIQLAKRAKQGEASLLISKQTEGMSSSEEDKMPLYPKGKKFYSDRYIKSTQSSQNRKCRLCIIVLILIIAICFAILLIGVIAGVLVHHVINNEAGTEPWLSKRLPSDAIPDTYTIKLDVDLGSLVVIGEEDILVNMSSDSKWILLQILDMNITGVSAMEANSNDQIDVSNSPYTENDYLIVENKNGVFSKGSTYIISVNFTYFLYSGGLAGFYNSTYKENGNDVVLATTQFEATDARRAFPCFDEPQLKSVFTITIVHPDDKIALSNMPVQSTTSIDNNRNVTIFQPSKKMSTYLVAFIVCDFESTSNMTKNNVKVSVWSRPSLVQDTVYALDVAVKIVEYYEDFFSITYPLPKMDLVAIPDFSSGAMENWGLITYRETALLYNPNFSSASDMQWVTMVIAHELAHQWFGNLVTMEWWEDLWLNEGFASYVEYIGTNITQPSWGYLNFFITGDLHVALEADGYNDTHPIIQPAETLSEINALFDSISYSKGASLIRMIADFMGMQDFQKGLTIYLNAHRYANARSADLWSALQETANTTEYNLTAVMDTWTIQAGYPVLNVSTSDCTSITVTQERFVIIPTDTFAESEFNYIWRVPFTYVTDEITSETIWINDTSKTIKRPQECKWIKANRKQSGFYRVMYDDNMWSALIAVLLSNPTTFEIDDRANLLDDSVALALAGRLATTQAFNLTSYLKKETEYIPWRAGLQALSQIHTKLIITRTEGSFSQFLLCLLNSEIQNALLNWTNGSDEMDHLANLKMNLILKYALLYGDSSVRERAHAEFTSFMINSTRLDPNLISIIYTGGIKFGGEVEWDHLWNIYNSSDNPTEQAACLSALAYTEKPWLIQSYLEKSLSEVRSQDRLTVLRRLGVNVYAWPYLWNFFKENYDLLISRHGATKSFGRAITAIISHFSTQSQLDEVVSFFSGRDVGAGETSLNSGIEQIKSNIQWKEDNLDSLDGWLSEWLADENNCMY